MSVCVQHRYGTEPTKLPLLVFSQDLFTFVIQYMSDEHQFMFSGQTEPLLTARPILCIATRYTKQI